MGDGSDSSSDSVEGAGVLFFELNNLFRNRTFFSNDVDGSGGQGIEMVIGRTDVNDPIYDTGGGNNKITGLESPT